MIEMTFYNKRHGTKTKGRVSETFELKHKQAERIGRDLCRRGCCFYPVDYALDLDGKRYFKDGLLLHRMEEG